MICEENKNGDRLTNWCLDWFGNLFDAIIVLLMVGLIITIFMKFWDLFVFELWSGGVNIIISEILFVLILVELFTILTSYLKNRKVKVQRIVEVGIISIIREVMFVVFKIPAAQILALAGLLLVFGALFAIEKFFYSDDEED